MPRRSAPLLGPLPLLLLSTIVFCVPSRAGAYCLQRFDGHPGYPAWSTSRVSFFISSTLTEISKRLAVEDAFDAWSNVPCAALSLQNGGSFDLTEAPPAAYSPGIYVYWHTSATTWPLAQHDVVASSTIRVAPGGIVRGSIEVNAFRYKWSTGGAPDALDVQGELTALIGKVLGLADSDTTDSVMTSALRFADVHKRDLRADDIAALRALYADPKCAPPPSPGPDGCGAPVAEQTTSKRLVSTDAPPSPASAGCADGCGPGAVCSAGGQCVAADSAADNAGGCRVGPAAARSTDTLSLLLLALAALALWRRRRR